MATKKEEQKPQDPTQDPSLQDPEKPDPPDPTKTNPEVLEGTPPTAVQVIADPDPKIDLLEGNP